MEIRTIKRSNGDNVVIFRPENGQGLRLLMTGDELHDLTRMLIDLEVTASDQGADTLVERKESGLGVYGFKHM